MHTQHEHDLRMMQLIDRYHRMYKKKKARNIAIYSTVIITVIITVAQLL